MKGLVFIGGLLSLIVFSGTAAAMDCRLGEKYYFQAKSSCRSSAKYRMAAAVDRDVSQFQLLVYAGVAVSKSG